MPFIDAIVNVATWEQVQELSEIYKEVLMEMLPALYASGQEKKLVCYLGTTTKGKS